MPSTFPFEGLCLIGHQIDPPICRKEITSNITFVSSRLTWMESISNCVNGLRWYLDEMSDSSIPDPRGVLPIGGPGLFGDPVFDEPEIIKGNYVDTIEINCTSMSNTSSVSHSRPLFAIAIIMIKKLSLVWII